LIQENTKVLANVDIAPGIFLMTVLSPQVASRAQPGQFLHLRVGAGADPLLRRPMSIFRVNAQKGQVSLLFRVKGRGTRALSAIREGETLDLIGPLGRGFSVPSGTCMVLLVAGGLGVAPLFFLAETLLKKATSVMFLMGAKSREKLVAREELRVLGVPLLVSTDDGSEGFRGLVTELLDKTLLEKSLDPQGSLLCSAGPQPMLSTVVALARRSGMVGQISMERHMACGLGACWGCVVCCRSSGGQREYRRVCTDGPVFHMEEIVFQE
jgi:dihydroorotate dehydrogenase electron transfer subunit